MKRTRYYLRLWCFFAKYALLAMLSQRLSFTIFFIGKVVRFVMYFLFLSFLVSNTGELAGLNSQQVLFIFLTFVLVDTAAQFLFREVYRFRPQVVSGGFDLFLTKPTNALFRSLLGGTDIIDLATLPPLILLLVVVGIELQPTVLQVLLYSALILNALLIAAAFHIIVLALGILTLTVDHTIMVYRDIASLGRFPVDIYREPLRSILTFVIPVGLMVTLPAKALLNLATPESIGITFTLGVLMIGSSLVFWQFAVRRYTSASS